MLLRTLGGLQLEGTEFQRPKPLLLLAYLALEGPQERGYLAELFFQGSSNGRHSLSTTLSRLRSSAPGVVEADDTHVRTGVASDVGALLGAVRGGDLERAVGLYRGRFLAGFDTGSVGTELEEWIYAQRESLAAKVRESLLDLGEQLAVPGQFEAAAEYAERAYLVSSAPEPEPRELSRIYTLLAAAEHPQIADVRSEAQAYGLTLTIEPEDARARLLQGPAKEHVPRHDLPAQPTRFVGREDEKARLLALLLDPECRLLTITGPGGIGKTRLAIEIASAQLGSFPDGVFFVPFAPVTSPSSMPYAITEALGVSTEGTTDARELLLGYLEKRQALLVLDNLEHLLDGTDLIHDLWERAPRVKLLITSRERLNLRAERVVLLSGLASHAEVPGEHSDAAALFLQTAQDRGHEEVLSQAAPSVELICQLVGGMPLAIELAASWLHVLLPQHIAQQLERGLDVLEASARDFPEQHQSIRGVFDHSWVLLSEIERGVLRRLSVFQGGFDLSAATEVAGASLPVLAGLCLKSLVTLSPSGRYEQHPLVLEYARERLSEQPGDETATREKHGLYYHAFLQEHYPGLSTSNINKVRELLDPEIPNFQAAWGWALADLRVDLIAKSAFPLHKLLGVGNRGEEAVELFSNASDRLDEENPEHHAALGYPLIGLSVVSNSPLDREERVGLLMRGLELLRPLGEELGMAWAQLHLVWLLLINSIAHDDEALARGYLEEGSRIARKVGNPDLIGRFLNARALVETEDLEGSDAYLVGSKRLYEQAVKDLREVGDPMQLIWGMSRLGIFLVRHEFFNEGKAALMEGLELAREYRLIGSVSDALIGLAEAALADDDLDEAEAFASELLQISRDYGPFDDHWALEYLGVIAIRRGELAEAEELLLELQLSRDYDARWDVGVHRGDRD